MKRRTFIANGVFFATELPYRTAKMLRKQQTSSVSQMLQAGMIWSASPSAVMYAGPPKAIANGAPHGAVVDTDEHVVFFRKVALPSAQARAVLHLFAFTRYRLYINGQYAGRGPSRFQNQRPEYDTRDIASLLRPGTNSLAILVHRDAPTGRIMSHAPGFAAVFETIDAMGRSQYLATDASWKAASEPSFGPRKQAWASIEENIDASVGPSWLAPEFDGAQWQAAVSASGTSLFPLWPRGTPLQSEVPQTWATGAPAFPLKLVAPAEINLNTTRLVQAYHLLEFEAAEGTQLETTYHLPDKGNSGSSTYIARAGEQTWMGGDSFCFSTLTLRVVSRAVSR